MQCGWQGCHACETGLACDTASPNLEGRESTVFGGDPNARRRRLGAALRGYREDRSLTQRQVAEELAWSRSKIIRIEAGTHGVSVTDLNALLAVYEVIDGDVVEDLREAARVSHGQPWWHGYRDLVSEQFARYLGYEDEAVEFRISHPFLVPGLLHTPAYAQDLLNQHSSPDRVRRIGEMRARRQERTLGRPGITCDFIVTEAAFHTWVGGPEGMREQLQHLLDAGQRPGVTIRVVPGRAGAHPGLQGPFNLLTLSGASGDVLYRESFTGDRLTRAEDDGQQVERYQENFTELCNRALPGGQGEDLLRQQIERLGQ